MTHIFRLLFTLGLALLFGLGSSRAQFNIFNHPVFDAPNNNVLILRFVIHPT